MSGLLGKGALLLSMSFMLFIQLLRLQAYDSAAVTAFLSARQDCTAPCWEGIQPGETRVTEALRILQGHAWVVDVRPVGREISWAWSGGQPAWIDASKRGSLVTFWDRVSSIMIPTSLRAGDLVLAGEHAESVSVTPLTGTRLIGHLAVYNRYALYNQITCPLSLASVWEQPAAMIIDRRILFDDNRQTGGYNVPLWWRELPECRGMKADEKLR